MTNSTWTAFSSNSRVINNSLIKPNSTSNLDNEILQNVGKYPHDAVDKRIIANFTNGGGNLIKNEDQVGGYPSLTNGKPYTDSDNDGMEDNWELRNNLDPNDGDDGRKDRNDDGYTNLEEFLHYLTVSS
jgi:hypothetical protein